MFYNILNKLWGSKEQILIVPPFFVFKLASFLVFQNIIMIINSKYDLIFAISDINEQNAQLSLNVLIVTLIVGPIIFLCTYTQFCKDMIYRRNLLHLFKPQLFSCEEISEVRIDTFTSVRGLIFLRYYLIFNNKNKININIMELHKGEFGTKKVTSFKNILGVEKYIPRKIPHFISEDAIYELESNHIYLKDNIYKKFQPRRIRYLKQVKSILLKMCERKTK
ncbi:MAG: hypothetical protein H7Y18_17485 [Clostridiaceae bacterium]|nr:hypothetical protein [Clostridiaceae bacterium]